uniref:Uncharacterized protein n=1 Tax=Tanacetum cinerariifolium TaxID=118510 RepID=A0A6L2N8F2_TANCI|nr:hypothetical protein [Tanacetum cinerariifolium]
MFSGKCLVKFDLKNYRNKCHVEQDTTKPLGKISLLDRATFQIYCSTTSVRNLMVKELEHAVVACWNMTLNGQRVGTLEAWADQEKKEVQKLKHEPFVKDGKLRNRGRSITCQSCGYIGHNKATCKGQGGKNAEASISPYRQATQAQPVVGPDGSSAPSVSQVPNAHSLGIGVVIGEFGVDAQPGRARVGVGS